MIGRLALLLAVGVVGVIGVVGAALATPAPSATRDTSRCDIVKYDKESEVSEVSEERWVSVDGNRRTVVVEWSSAAERAAAALLASALRLAGYRSTRLRRGPLALAGRSDLPYDPSEAVVILAARWSPGDVWSGWLQAVGASLVPVAPRLHRRCPPPPPPPPPRTAARCCATTTHELTKLYVVDEWKRLIDITQFNESIVVDRRKLLDLIRGDDGETFAFLDVELWSDEPNVEVVEGPVEGPVGAAVGAVGARALSVADGTLWRYSPALWHLLSYFEPRRSDLRHLLTLDAGDDDPMVAVCEWAGTSPRLLDRLRTWAAYVGSLRYLHHAYVFLCSGASAPENDTVPEYNYLLKKLEDELNSKERRVILDPKIVNCDDDAAARRTITDLIQAEIFYRTIGVIGPGRIFGEMTSFAESKKLTLVSYSTVGEVSVGAVGGRPGTVVRALRRLLPACGWRRLAVLSARDRVSAELSAALRAENDLNLKDISLTSNRAAIRDVLQSLKSSDARVFLVNAGAQLAGVVVGVAAELGLTTGRVWLAREWAAGGGGGGAGPYELTLAWRGGGGGDGGARSPLWHELQARWSRRGSWPLYAAPLADAVLALGKGYNHIFRVHRNFYDDVHSNDTFRTFWNVTETEAIESRGVVQRLRFKDRELTSPRVFLYRWNGTRAALLAEWRVGGVGGVGACPLPAPAPSDGSVRCVVPVGDRFDQRCGDTWLLASVLALAALVPLLLMAALKARRALRDRDALLVRRAEEMLEARWRAKASRLEPYFVERRALKLCEQIGAGRFGRVFLGYLREPATATEAGTVAAKALREDAAPVEETEFFREARALAALQHENVVRFVGVCVTDGPPLLLMEYAFFGDLLRYLRARRHLVGSDSPEAAQVSAEALTRFARQAAAALAYLARRGYVHRDLRAANCLVDERRDLKLADFGMARATRPADGPAPAGGDGEYTSRRRALFPVLWMAPESLSRGVFSAASDVWALGVLALELVTLGARPYGALSPLQVHHAVVTEGRRPPLPRELGAEARGALLACWRRAPGARPTAAALAAWLAGRPRALAPAPRAAADDCAEDVDSGIGEPRPGTSSCFDDVVFNDDDESLY